MGNVCPFSSVLWIMSKVILKINNYLTQGCGNWGCWRSYSTTLTMTIKHMSKKFRNKTWINYKINNFYHTWLSFQMKKNEDKCNLNIVFHSVIWLELLWCNCLSVCSDLSEAFRISCSRGDMYSNGGRKSFIPCKSLIHEVMLSPLCALSSLFYFTACL